MTLNEGPANYMVSMFMLRDAYDLLLSKCIFKWLLDIIAELSFTNIIFVAS